MYDHLTFPEYVTTILTKSVRDFQPLYMRRFRSYKEFNSNFPDFESFLEFYSHMLLQAKERAIGDVRLIIEPNYHSPEIGLIAYNFYDERHVHPIFSIKVEEIGNTIALHVLPF